MWNCETNLEKRGRKPERRQTKEMKLFDAFIRRKDESVTDNPYQPTTRDFFMGVAEAEGEAVNSKITLADFFEDYLNVMEQLNNEKFIVLGRKGSGKSAIGESIYLQSQNMPNIFCDFIKKSDIDIEYIVQVGITETGETLSMEMLYRWVILTKLLTLFSQNVRLQDNISTNLKKFLQKNRGFIDIQNNEVKQVIRQTKFGIQTEYFKRVVSAVLNRNIMVKENPAPFYKLLPDLQDTVLTMMRNDKENNYILIFDDLDIKLDCNKTESLNSLAELLRISKQFNNELFGKNNLLSKIVVLLRNDISKVLVHQADTAKIFSSYAVELNWYDDREREHEETMKLKQLINRRIKLNFDNRGYVINHISDPWDSFVDEKSFMANSKSSFKYVLDHTFYRPRDLILVFKDISDLNLNLPLSKNDIDMLLNKYSIEVMRDINNEMAAFFSQKEIDITWNILRKFNRRHFGYDELKTELEKYGVKDNSEVIINSLFEYSLIGNFRNNNYIFKFREKGIRPYVIDESSPFLLHYVLQSYYKQVR